jgi:hypothetical protein
MQTLSAAILLLKFIIVLSILRLTEKMESDQNMVPCLETNEIVKARIRIHEF